MAMSFSKPTHPTSGIAFCWVRPTVGTASAPPRPRIRSRRRIALPCGPAAVGEEGGAGDEAGGGGGEEENGVRHLLDRADTAQGDAVLDPLLELGVLKERPSQGRGDKGGRDRDDADAPGRQLGR